MRVPVDRAKDGEAENRREQARGSPWQGGREVKPLVDVGFPAFELNAVARSGGCALFILALATGLNRLGFRLKL